MNASFFCIINADSFYYFYKKKKRHTFCKDCIHQALENSSVCPIDRSTLSANEFQTAVKIIHNMVNELLVYCPRQGCPFTGQRQYIESHVANDCEYTIAPCELDECKELLLKKDLNTHAETCKYRTAECNMCKKKLRIFELEVRNNKVNKTKQASSFLDAIGPLFSMSVRNNRLSPLWHIHVPFRTQQASHQLPRL
jgi:hypothetical protein